MTRERTELAALLIVAALIGACVVIGIDVQDGSAWSALWDRAERAVAMPEAAGYLIVAAWQQIALWFAWADATAGLSATAARTLSAAAAFAAAAFLLRQVPSTRYGVAVTVFALFNPLFLIAAAAGEPWAYVGGLAMWRAVHGFHEPPHARSAARFALSALFALLCDPAFLFIAPMAALAAIVIAPRGAQRQSVLAVLIALLAPAAMLSGAVLYLGWLYGDGPLAPFRDLIAPEANAAPLALLLALTIAAAPFAFWLIFRRQAPKGARFAALVTLFAPLAGYALAARLGVGMPMAFALAAAAAQPAAAAIAATPAERSDALLTTPAALLAGVAAAVALTG